ncbi:MAG: T9SS type A sorting domain-containing protein [Bacteroidetes bacterium]|nr:T9SS type A sorting domain-containing protein [Bacteroidota bacterium]
MKKILQSLLFLMVISITAISQNRITPGSTTIREPQHGIKSKAGFSTELILENPGTTTFKMLCNNDYLLMEQVDEDWDQNESIWEIEYKFTYTYDISNNNLIEELKEWYYSTNNVVNFSKRVYIYNGDNILVEDVLLAWDTSYWENNYKRTYFYDANNNLVEERHFTWSMQSEWRNLKKFINAYDINNNLIQTTNTYWNGSTWVNDEKHTYLNDGNNNLIESVRQDWDGSDWVNYWKLTYLYDENNNPVEIWRKSWNGSEWVNAVRYLSTFDQNNNMIMSLTQTWDGSGWFDEHRYLYTFDNKNNQVKMLSQTWFDYKGEAYWLNQDKSTFYYLPAGSETIEYNRSDLNKAIEDFQTTEDDLLVELNKFGYKTQALIGVEVVIDSVLHSSDSDLEFTLTHKGISEVIIYHAGGDGDNFIGTKLTDNALDSISKGTAPFAGIYKPENPLSLFTGTDPEGTWTLSIYDGVAGNTGSLQAWSIILIYSSSSGIENNHPNKPDDIYIYPNPVTDIIHCRFGIPHYSCYKIEILDLLGKSTGILCEGNTASGKVQVDVGQLPAGAYLFKIQMKDKILISKFIKK